jgi:hypothetical protein
MPCQRLQRTPNSGLRSELLCSVDIALLNTVFKLDTYIGRHGQCPHLPDGTSHGSNVACREK